MTRTSTIKRLPREIQERIGKLREAGHTIDEILAKLSELDVAVSRSALGRHVQHLDTIGERIRSQRALAEALVDRFGEAPENRVAMLNVELMHGILFRLTAGDSGEPVQLDAREAMFLSKALKDTIGAERDAGAVVQLRQRLTREITEKATAAVDQVARSAGISADTVAKLKAEFLGMRT